MRNTLLILITIGLYLTLPNMSFSQENITICTSLEQLKANEGKQVLMFGELARHHQLPHHPYILLLEDNEWIFLGNKDFFQEQGFFSGKISQYDFCIDRRSGKTEKCRFSIG